MQYQKLEKIQHKQWIDKVQSLLQSPEFPCLFESSSSNNLHEWSILFCISDTQQWQYPAGRHITLNNTISNHLRETLHFPIQDASDHNSTEVLPPFAGGYLIYLSYEYAAYIEPSLRLPSSTYHDEPFLAIARSEGALAFHHPSNQVWASAESTTVLKHLSRSWKAISPYQPQHTIATCLQADDPSHFVHAVHQVLEHIKHGDIFQANISRQWQAKCVQGHAIDWYDKLRYANPSPMAAFWQFNPDQALLSSSPERLVTCHNRIIQTRPIAGTRPRNSQKQKDKQLAVELLQHTKERAEHIMLLDLERNDLGRIAVAGSVQVDELMAIESYAHVHHIVSNIRATARKNVSPLDIIHATFPGGTITGCPKVECMKIIASLEQAPRVAYTGSVGYITLEGRLDINILIRSILLRHDQFSFRAGAGIVYDSIPKNELEETYHKARGMIKALGL